MEKILEMISDCEEVELIVSFDEAGFLSSEEGWIIKMNDGSTYQLKKATKVEG